MSSIQVFIEGLYISICFESRLKDKTRHFHEHPSFSGVLLPLIWVIAMVSLLKPQILTTLDS